MFYATNTKPLKQFPGQLGETLERTANDVASLRPLVDLAEQMLCDMLDYHTWDGRGEWIGYQDAFDHRKSLRAGEWETLRELRHKALKATQIVRELDTIMTGVAAMYPILRAYQQRLNAYATTPDGDAWETYCNQSASTTEPPVWLADAPDPEQPHE